MNLVLSIGFYLIVVGIVCGIIAELRLSRPRKPIPPTDAPNPSKT